MAGTMLHNLMDNFNGLTTSHKVVCVVGGVAVVAASVVVVKKLSHRKKPEYPRDTVILHQVGRGPYAPSLSPYIVKMETFLRMAKIPYQSDHSKTRSSKGKWPWIEYNGEAVADSEFCILFLNKKFNVDLNKQLTTYDRAVAQAVRVMVDEHMAWCLGMFKYIFDEEIRLMMRFVNLPRVFRYVFKMLAKRAMYYQGIGRHNKEEVTLLLERELKVIADILGQKKYLMGDKPCEADSAVFGHLSQFYWHAVDTELENFIKDKYPTLAAYCERIKTNYWPDWDECTTRGFTAVAAK